MALIHNNSDEEISPVESKHDSKFHFEELNKYRIKFSN